jgi:hypothetical protein
MVSIPPAATHNISGNAKEKGDEQAWEVDVGFKEYIPILHIAYQSSRILKH